VSTYGIWGYISNTSNICIAVYRYPTGLQPVIQWNWFICIFEVWGCDPKNAKTHCISIKTYGTELKFYNTSQLYLSVPPFYPMWANTYYSMFSFFGSQWLGSRKHKTRNATRKPIKSLYLDKSIRNWAKILQYLPIVFISTLFYPMWANTYYSMFSFFGSQWVPENTKPGTRPENQLSHCISMKAYGTRLKLYNTSQLYLSVPPFYPMWANTYYSMFSFFGSQVVPENTKPGTRPENQLSHCISIKAFGTRLKHLPIVFINTPFLPYVG